MAESPALMQLVRQNYEASIDARDAAIEVRDRQAQLEARVAALEAKDRVSPKPDNSLGASALAEIGKKPTILLYLGGALALAMGGPAAITLANSILPSGASHAAVQPTAP